MLREVYGAYRRERRRLDGMASFPIAQEALVYHCALTAGRRRNLALQQVNRALWRWGEVSLPHILHVGVSSHCNLRCPACPTGSRALGRPAGHFDADLFEDVLRELRRSLMLVLLWDWGEPLLHPRLAEMVARARARDVRAIISTNGTVNNSEEQIGRLVEAGPDSVIVCVDGADQAGYESYRVGGRLADVMDTLRRLAAAKERLGVKRPVVEFRSLATRHTERQVPELLAMAEDVGADLFTIKTLRPYDYRGRDIDGELVPLSDDLARYEYADGSDRDPSARVAPMGPLRCGKPLYAPSLDSDGKLSFCNYASQDNEIFGPVEKGGLRRLWRSVQARDKRRHFETVQGTRSCGPCFFRSDHPPTILHAVPLRELPAEVSVARPETRDDLLEAIAVAPATSGGSRSE